MFEKDDATILDTVAAAFEPYLRQPQELSKARRFMKSHLAARVKDIQEGSSADMIAKKVQGRLNVGNGLRSEYLQAIRAKVAAKCQYDGAAARSFESAQDPEYKNDTTALLEQHLCLIRLQNRHAELVGLRDELEVARLSPGLAATDIRPVVAEAPVSTRPREDDLSVLSESIKQSMITLEMAVVQAHHEAKRQKALLDRVKSETADTNIATPERRGYAMSSVRKELTAWLEESLDKCQDASGALEADGDVDGQESDTASDANIDGQYERYLEARREILAAVADLRAPLPERESKALDDSRVPVMQNATSTQTVEMTSILNAVEKWLLPSIQRRRVSRAHFELAEEQLQKEVRTTIDMLDRLGDESQLLQAFAILAGSGRFEHAASTFGNKQDGPASETKGEISNRLDSWLFAAEAADVASTGTIEKQLQQGKEAMDTAMDNLNQLRLLGEAGS